MSPTFVASTQSLAEWQPTEGTSVSGTLSVGLRYRFGAGWKFVRIEPKDAVARKIVGEPRAFGIWVHGDGQGGTPCIRLRDSTGQVHQVRGEPITWKGWRYVTFPLRPAADAGQMIIPDISYLTSIRDRALENCRSPKFGRGKRGFSCFRTSLCRRARWRFRR